MKSGIDDYFLQGTKDNDNVVSETNSGISKIKSITEGTALKDTSDNAVTDGKENVKSKGKMANGKTVKGKPKNPSKKGSPPMKKVTKKRTLSMKKPNHKDEQESSAAESNKDKVEGDGSKAPNFALRIRMKNKEQEDKDNFIDDFSSPEQPKGKSKELKSPQGLMFKYLVSPKNSEPVQKETSSTTKLKAGRDISDFFSPSKGNSSNSDSALSVDDKKEVDRSKADKSEKPPVDEPLEKKATSKNKETTKSRSAKKTKANALSGSKKQETGNSSVSKEVDKKTATTTVKQKSVKKSLSLTKNETVSKKEDSPLCSVESNPNIPVVKSMNNAFQAIMAKASQNKVDPPQSVPDMFSKKRKRENDDELDAGNPSETTKDNSPVRSKKRYSNTNQIESDSDCDITDNAKTIEELSGTHRVSTIDNQMESADALSKTEESKRHSLMSYFSKVTKEEAMAKEEKIEMKVQAMVHSPPTTPSKKTKRRSVNSLPGGALSLSKKKNVKAKLKDNINAIDVMDAEESKGIDTKSKDSSRSAKKQSSPSSKSSKTSAKSETLKTPQKSLSLKSAETSNSKADTSKSAKKSLSRRKGKLEKNKSKPNTEPEKTSKNCAADEECLAVPLQDETAVETPQTPSASKWTMRVCLTPCQIPSSQGTLLEEESDCEEIFSSRQDKKRKLSKESVNEKDKEYLHEEKSQSPDIIFEKETKQSVKIAPLFTRKADTQARQLFLQSGVPDQVKRVLETQRSYEEQETDLFPKESHIQQRNNEEWVWNLPHVEFPLKTDFVEKISQISTKFSLSDVTGCSDFMDEFNHIVSASCKGPDMRPIFSLPVDIMKPILRLMKLGSPDFKVVNTFKVLRSKLREEEFAKAAALSAMSELEKPKRKSTNRKSTSSKQAQPMATFRARCWTEKYKPCTASEIVGNGTSIQQLKRWLESWRKASEDYSNKPFVKEDVKRKKKRMIDDDDDFLASDSSCDVGQNNFPVGVAVLCGPNGSGKTSSVYALAKDLGYKVLEVNASEKRNGKLVLSKLSEATQSHQVQQGPTAEQGFAALFGSNSAKSKKQPVKVLKPKTNDGDDDKTKKMSLILFEDVDIVFEEEDEGFLSAITTLVSTSKRPVILTTTDPESPMVHRFINSASVVLPFSCSPNLITVWLQIVSLLEGVYAAPDTVKDLVSLCKGDFRKAILQMQLWVTSGGNNLPMPTMAYTQHGRKSKKNSKNDESDDMSDLEADPDNHNCSPSIPANPDCIAPMLGKNDVYQNSKESELKVRVPFPLDMGLFWWNIPPMLSLQQLKHAALPVIKEDIPTPAIGSGLKRMLDDSFIASFCTDDGNTTDSGVNDSDTTCSQATSIAENGDLQGSESFSCNPSQSSVTPIPYTSTCSQEEMLALYYPLVTLSFIDVIGHASQPNISSNMEPITRFCNPIMKDSLSLTKSEEDGPNCVLNSTAQEISHWLAEQSLNQARTCLCTDKATTSTYSYCLPDEDEIRWRQAHAETERVTLQATPLSVSLDRRALFTDYMPVLRIFCQLERNRSCINIKRRNRFFHYLKSLGAHPNEAQLELLCRSLSDSKLFLHTN